MYLKIINLIYMYKYDLALNNLQLLICYKPPKIKTEIFNRSKADTKCWF